MTTPVKVVSGFVCVAVMMALGVAFAQQPSLVRNILQRGDLAAQGYEGVMVHAEFPAGANVGKHTHPGEEITYILDGTIQLEVDGKPAQTLKAGQVFWVPAGVPHDAKNTGAGSATIVVTYVVKKGEPLSMPVK